mmetsp:Transcript_31360/g.57551  ORF Transcript_31360/g.57551 Transcript_31360/m.57551 type:complete len:237 (+) Transcript_31360:101-811(+)
MSVTSQATALCTLRGTRACTAASRPPHQPCTPPNTTRSQCRAARPSAQNHNAPLEASKEPQQLAVRDLPGRERIFHPHSQHRLHCDEALRGAWHPQASDDHQVFQTRLQPSHPAPEHDAVGSDDFADASDSDHDNSLHKDRNPRNLHKSLPGHTMEATRHNRHIQQMDEPLLRRPHPTRTRPPVTTWTSQYQHACGQVDVLLLEGEQRSHQSACPSPLCDVLPSPHQLQHDCHFFG